MYKAQCVICCCRLESALSRASVRLSLVVVVSTLGTQTRAWKKEAKIQTQHHAYFVPGQAPSDKPQSASILRLAVSLFSYLGLDIRITYFVP